MIRKTNVVVFFLLLLVAVLPTWAADSGEEFTRTLVAREVTNRADLRSQQPGANPGPVLKARDFGLSSHASPVENSLALERLGVALSQKKASAASFEPGDYRVQLRANNPGLLLDGLHDFTIQGNGARLLFQDSTEKSRNNNAFLKINNCERLLVDKLALVWDWDEKPLCVIGRITTVKPEGVEYEVVSGGALKPGYNITGGREWDTEIQNRSPKGYPPGFSNAAKIVDAKHLFFEGKAKGSPAPGQCSLLKIIMNADVWGVALEGSNDHLTFDALQIRGAPNSAMCGFSKHLWIKNCIVAPPREGLYKACEDCFIIDSEFYVVEDSEVQYALDDISNFRAGHLGAFMAGGILPDGPNGLIADGLQFYSNKGNIFKGADFFLADKNFTPLPWHSKVKSFQWQMNYHPAPNPAANRCRIVFEDPVPAITDAKDFYLMHERKNEGAYLIRNNRFSNNACHGIWAGNGPGLIEDNTFFQTAYPAIGVMMISRAGRWFKGFYPEGVIIRNNVLNHCNTALRPPADIYAATGWDQKQFTVSTYPAVHHLIIEKNTVKRSSQCAIAVLGVSDAIVSNNLIVDPGQNPLATNSVTDAALCVMRSKGGRVEGNILQEKPGASVKGIQVTESTDFITQKP